MKSSPLIKISIAIVVFIIGIAITFSPAIKKLDYSFLDLMMMTEHPEKAPQSVVVAVDQYTYSLLGFPIDKSIFAAMVSVLHEAKAKKIGFDLFFTDRKEEKDPEAIKRMIESEELLGEIGSNSGVIFGSFVNRDFRNDPANVKNYPPTPAEAKTECPCIDEKDTKGKFSFLEPLVPGVAKFNPEIAHVHVIPSEIDRVNRTMIGCIKVFDGCIPDLATAMTGKKAVKEDCEEQIIPYFRSADKFDVISMTDVIEASENENKMKELEKRIKDKFVFVGATDETLKDVGPTPSGKVEPLVFLHVNRAEALLNNIRIKPVSLWIPLLIVFILLVPMLLFVEKARYYLIISASSVFFAFLFSLILFRTAYYFFQPMSFLMPVFLATLAAASYIGWKYFLFNQVLSNAFDNYVSPEILQWLKETGGKVLQSNSAERREITILFSDIAGYTSLSNSLNAEGIMKSLRLYLDEMMTITAEYNGYVDKINGDGLMILFGAPKPFSDHALRAVDCAQSMQKKVFEMQKEWTEITGRELKIRIGIATDTVFVGNLGGAGHIEYSAIGRGVNFAARLESKSDVGGILISEETIKSSGIRPDGYKRSVELKGYDSEVAVWQVKPVDYSLLKTDKPEQNEKA
ncbi:MAG TPA: adenylate/guanylate cyclase domain-containing protein [bacterium]|nr:adenylate/guanylate cyclase domain-containing protein [bacterium]HPS30960.1 adenylate/guanylate cyclase domain-containing protein [bacterium]